MSSPAFSLSLSLSPLGLCIFSRPRVPFRSPCAAYYNDILIGAIACRLESKGNGKAKLYIMTLGVLAPYRDLGVGTHLLEHSLRVAMEDPNIEEAYLHVQTSNDGAIRFYDKHGFAITEMIPNYYKRIDPPDCYILHRSLV